MVYREVYVVGLQMGRRARWAPISLETNSPTECHSPLTPQPERSTRVWPQVDQLDW